MLSYSSIIVDADNSSPEVPTEDAQLIRVSSPITTDRVPSFRNSIEPITPRSLTRIRKPVQTDQRLYERRYQHRDTDDDMPAFFRYFRRQPPANRPTLSSGTNRNTSTDTYFLPSPTTQMSRQRFASESGSPQIQPPLSSAISNTSVIYNEIDEVSEVPEGVCCTEHIRREIDAMTVDLLREANATQKSVTPPPPYIECMK